MGKIFYLMGKSASGKDTLYKMIIDACPQMKTVVLYTTRPMRSGEHEGVEYHFITSEQLRVYENQGKVIEARTYETVNGPWTYATVDDGRLDLKKDNYLAIGTLDSYKKTREYFGEETVIPLFISLDEGLRLERALARERQQQVPNYAELCRRYLADEADFAPERLHALGINEKYDNTKLEDCLKEIMKRMERDEKA